MISTWPTPERWSGQLSRHLYFALFIVAITISVTAQTDANLHQDWQRNVREQSAAGRLEVALKVVEARLHEQPGDLEAHGWRGRVLAWKGRWADAEDEYRIVLRLNPDDVEILCGLADVLFWQRRNAEALQAVDRARSQSPSDAGILVRRARILRALGRSREARDQFHQVLHLDPRNAAAKSGLTALSEEYRHELRFGNDVDTFNYTNAAQTQSAVLTSRWNGQWSTTATSNIYQRFGSQAQRFALASAFRWSRSDWITFEGAGANDHGIIPKADASCELGHGFHWHQPLIRALDLSYQQRWLWYSGAHIETFSLTQLYYLPKNWTWRLTVRGARSGIENNAVDWLPSGDTRLGFPILRGLTGNLMFGVGSEDFGYIDQMGRFSAHTYGGGLRLRVASNQDVQGFVARQDRSENRSQTSYGVSYGIRF